ncbi:MAG TPA: DUF4145 domain-containing protein [Pyrinomonadaceae bacterium]|jgi:hypothetical protein|nr:DUF4145 domain-containing protein [Pyrinomonadaceae bacterium]
MKKIEKLLYCPFDGHPTTQELKHVHREKSAGDWTEASGKPIFRDIDYYVAYCKHGGLLLYSSEKGDLAKADHTNNLEILWPDPGFLPQSVPEEVQKSYIEAQKSRNYNPDTFGFHIRRGLEAVCDNCGIQRYKENKKGFVPLSHRIKELVKQRELPTVMTKMIDAVKDWCNEATHYHLDPRLVPDLDLFFRGIVHYVYIWPERLRAMLHNIKDLNETKTLER